MATATMLPLTVTISDSNKEALAFAATLFRAAGQKERGRQTLIAARQNLMALRGGRPLCTIPYIEMDAMDPEQVKKLARAKGSKNRGKYRIARQVLVQEHKRDARRRRVAVLQEPSTNPCGTPTVFQQLATPHAALTAENLAAANLALPPTHRAECEQAEMRTLAWMNYQRDFEEGDKATENLTTKPINRAHGIPRTQEILKRRQEVTRLQHIERQRRMENWDSGCKRWMARRHLEDVQHRLRLDPEEQQRINAAFSGLMVTF